MEKIKIGESDQQYEIAEIRPVSEHVMRIVFVTEIPAKFGDVTVYTSGGYQCANLPGYDTVYRNEGQTVYLSNDGSVYVETEEPGEVLPPEPYVPTLAELQSAKRQEVSRACEQIIYNGVSVVLGDGSTEHYALTEHDQLNLFGKQAQLVTGVTQLEYHADGQPCRYYSAADMQLIIQAAMQYVSYHTTYCNALNMWVAGCQTADELSTIFYGADVPEEYQSEVLKAYLVEIVNMTGGADGEVS